MRTLFISQDLQDIVQDGYESPTNEEELLNLQRGVSKTIFSRISGARKSKEAWKVLKVEFQRYDRVISIKLQSLWRDFDNLVMQKSETIQEFFS